MDERIHDRRVGMFVGILCGLSFGTASILIRLLPTISSVSIVFMRLLIAFTFLFFLLFMRRKIHKLLNFFRSYPKKAIFMGSLLGLHFLTFTQSVKDTTVLAATILVNTVPIQTLLIGLIFFRLKATKQEVMAILFGFLGATFIFTPNIQGGWGRLIGDLEALIAATFVALYTNIGREVRQKKDTNLIMVSNFLFGTLTTLFIAYLTPLASSFHIPWDPFSLCILLLLGIIPTAIGHSLFIASVKVLKPHEIATLALLEPASATILAWFLFEESPSLFSLIGGGLIGFALYLLFKQNKSE